MKKFLLLLVIVPSLIFGQQSETLSVPHKLSVLPHTGQLSMSVELFHLSDPDFETSFSLNYLSSGFTPMVASGVVGNDWSVSMGGKISRQVVGLPDDVNHVEQASIGNRIVDVITQKGLCTLLNSSSPKPSYDQLYTSNTYSHYSEGSYEIDWASDVYYFSVFGSSGAFIIGIDGKAQIISGDFMEVSLDEMGEQRNQSYYKSFVHFPDDFTLPNRSVIVLKDKRGYTYKFGGNAEALTFNFTLQPKCLDGFYVKPDVQEWYLEEVIAPNGRRLNYHYHTPNTSALLDYDFHTSMRFDTLASISNRYFTLSSIYLPTSSVETKFHLIEDYYSVSRVPMLDSITTSDGSLLVSCMYSSLDDYQYSSLRSGSWGGNMHHYSEYIPTQSYFLSNVSVSNDSIELSRWTLSYSSLLQVGLNSYCRQYLSGLRHESGIEYQFAYNLNGTAVANKYFNHWKSLDGMGYYTANPMVGTLTSMSDPLGCTTSFTYAKCIYDSIRILTPTTSGFQSVIRPTTETHLNYGIVVTGVTKTDDSGQQLSRKRYVYGDELELPSLHQNAPNEINSTIRPEINMGGTSSGILNIYYALELTQGLSKNKKYIVRSYETPGINWLSSVEYSRVSEICYDSNNTKVRSTTFYYDQTQDIVEASCSSDYYTFLLDMYPYWSLSDVRSRLRQVDIYKGNQLCQREKYSYNPLNDEHTTKIVGRYGSCAVKMSIPSKDWSRHEVISYEDGGEYHTSEELHYDNKRRVVETLNVSPEQVYFVRHTYPDQLFSVGEQISDHNSLAYGYLWLKNREGEPVQSISGFVKDSTYYVTNGAITLYDVYNWKGVTPRIPWPFFFDDIIIMSPKEGVFPYTGPEFVAPRVVLALHLSNPIPMSDYTPLSFVGHQTIWDSRYDTIATYDYSSKLRPITITQRGQQPLFYQWDSRGLNILSTSQGMMQHTYTYIPYRGISSDTDELGVTTYYTYDLLGNLVEVYRLFDSGKKILLKKNWYHYNSQQ